MDLRDEPPLGAEPGGQAPAQRGLPGSPASVEPPLRGASPVEVSRSSEADLRVEAPPRRGPAPRRTPVRHPFSLVPGDPYERIRCRPL